MILYHYCSNNSFLSIIGGSSIRASEFSLSNDHMEGKWSRKLLEQFCSAQTMYPIQQSLLLEEFDAILSYFGAVGFCLSEDGDLLSQWRGYADDGCGVAIGFDSDFFGNLPAIYPDHIVGFDLRFIPVEYDLEKQREIVKPHFEEFFRLSNNGALSKPTLLSNQTEEEHEGQANELRLGLVRFTPHLYALKNPAFKEEREWRLISMITAKSNRLSSAVSEGKSRVWELPSLDYHAKSDRLVPFRSFSLDHWTGKTHPIREVVLGPKNITPPSFVEGALMRHGVHLANVRRSSASYR